MEKRNLDETIDSIIKVCLVVVIVSNAAMLVVCIPLFFYYLAMAVFFG